MAPRLKVKSFLDYVNKTNVVSAGVGFTTGLAVNDLFTKVIDELVVNQVKRHGKGMDTLKVDMGMGVSVQYGPMLMSAIKLVLVLLVSYAILRVADTIFGMG